MLGIVDGLIKIQGYSQGPNNIFSLSLVIPSFV